MEMIKKMVVLSVDITEKQGVTALHPAYLHQNNNSHSQCCVSYCFIQEEYEDEHSVKRCVPKPVQKMHGLFLFSMK